MFPLAHVGGPVFEPLQVFGLTLVATAYAFRTMTLAHEGRPVPTWRAICFAAGLLLIAVAFLSPLGHLDTELVLAHMSQHLLMGDVGALLIVLGLTGPLLQPLLHNRWLGSIRHLAHPLVALPLWAVDLYLWHLPIITWTAQPLAYLGWKLPVLQAAAGVAAGALSFVLIERPFLRLRDRLDRPRPQPEHRHPPIGASPVYLLRGVREPSQKV